MCCLGGVNPYQCNEMVRATIAAAAATATFAAMVDGGIEAG
jgi:hypothetical protein